MPIDTPEQLLYPPRAGSDLDAFSANLLNERPEHQLGEKELETVRRFEGALMATDTEILSATLKNLTASTEGLDKLAALHEEGASSSEKISLEQIAQLPAATCNVYLEDFVEEPLKERSPLEQRQFVTNAFIEAKNIGSREEIADLIKKANQSMRKLESDIAVAVFEAKTGGASSYHGPEPDSAITVIYDAKTLTQKVAALKANKHVYKKTSAAISQINESGALNQDDEINNANLLSCMAFLTDLYLKRNNVELASSYAEVGALFEQTYFSRDSDIPQQLPYLQKLAELVPGMRMGEGATVHVTDDETKLWMHERVDKFLHGAESRNVDDEGKFGVIGKNLEDKVGAAEREEAQLEPVKIFMGFRPEQYKDVKFNAEDYVHLSRLALKEYGLFSATQNYDENDPIAQKLPAEDDLIRVAVVDGQDSASYDPIAKVLKVPKSLDRSVAQLNPAGILPNLDHEIAHVIQNYNKQQLGLRLFDILGGDRKIVMAEAGALAWEKETYEEEFGIRKPKTHQYLAAIGPKMSGGGIFNSVAAFYEETYGSPLSDGSSVGGLKTAVNRVLRQYRLPGTKHISLRHGQSTQSLVYSEEIALPPLLVGEAKKYLLVGGANISALAKLHNYGLLPENLLLPDQKPSQLSEVREYIRQKIAIANGSPSPAV